MKSIAKEEEKKQRISESELKQIQKLQETRDQLALQLGAIFFEFETAKTALNASIAKVAEEQKVLGSLLITGAGFDLEKKNYSIDIKTGDIKEV